MFQYIPILISLIILVFALNFIICFNFGGIRKNLLNFFTNFIFIFYLFLTPTVFYFKENYIAFEMDVKQYFGIGFLQILLHLIFYNIGYFIFIKWKRNDFDFTDIEIRVKNGLSIQNIIFIMFILFYVAIFINTLTVGINLIDVFLGNHGDPTMGLRGGSYYIQNLADSLISIIVLSFFFKIKRGYFYCMIIFILPLFLILGFRYRIILSFFGIFLVYIYDNKIKLKSFIKYIIIVMMAFYSLLLLTHNRYQIYMQQFDKLSYDISEFDTDIIFNQSRGSMIDFAVYQHISNNKASIDFGETNFGYIIIKMLPSFVFSNNTKPYPPPSFIIIDDAINGTRDNGEAVTALGSMFISFYYPGIYLFAFLLGIVIAKLQNRFGKNYLSMVGSIIANLAIFQWITRGYFPQEIDHLSYMLLPIGLILIFAKQKGLEQLN